MKHSDLKSGDLLYWKGKGFYAWLVRWATREKFWKFWTTAPYSHVAVFWRNGSAEEYIESQPGFGVRVMPMFEDTPQFAQHTHTAWSGQMVHIMIAPLMHRPYSKWTAVATLFGVAGKGSSSFMCSELSQRILSGCGWNFKGKKYHPFGLSLAVTRANPEYTVESLEG